LGFFGVLEVFEKPASVVFLNFELPIQNPFRERKQPKPKREKSTEAKNDRKKGNGILNCFL
jgi:hypothetical protein